MFTRREFLQIGAMSAGIILINPFGIRYDEAVCSDNERTRKYLYGNPKRGCSAPCASPESITDIGSGVDAFENFAYSVPLNNGRHC
jgi:hypothetical protein